MNEIFNPTLVISVGPFGKKALDFLQSLLGDIPEHFRELIELYDIESLEKSYSFIQETIDSKLLSAKRLNRLVDLGFKIRMEDSSDIKINLYLFWDVYNGNVDVSEVVKILYEVKYGNIDKSRYSGVSLFIIPIIDREWLYEKEQILKGIKDIKRVINMISIPENMMFINSKVYLLHSISKDGTRIGEEELESICAIITYLNILPSAEPPLATINKRLLKHEGNFKIGTIGISSLSIFKDRVMEEFQNYLKKDLIDYSINNENFIDFKNYESISLVNEKVILKNLKQGLPIIEKEEDIILHEQDKFKISILKEGIWQRDITTYAQRLKQWEETIKNEYIDKLKDTINEKRNSFNLEIEGIINKELNSIILTYGLKAGEVYLKDYLLQIHNKGKGRGKKNSEVNEEYYNTVKKEIDNFPNILGFIIRIILSTIFFVYSMYNIFTTFEFMTIDKKIFYIGIIITIGLGLILLDFVYRNKRLNKKINKYINTVYRDQGSIIKEYLNNEVDKFKELLEKYVNKEIKNIKECKENLININDIKNENEISKKYEFENLITDLLNLNDRKVFYNEHKDNIPFIYSRFISKLDDFSLLKEWSIKERINSFTNDISNQYVNIDFNNYLKIKWRDRREEEIEKWIDKGLIKSKELLQFNEGNEVEKHKLFLGSKDFISEYNNILKEKMTNFNIISIDGRDVFTNCISIIKISLGIDINSITPFMNIREEEEQ